MGTDYDRRTAAEPAPKYDSRKLIELTEMAEHNFKAGVALIENAKNLVRQARLEAQGQVALLPEWERSGPKGSGFRAIYDYAKHLVEAIDETKILQQNWMLRWFEEFASETKAHLKDLK